MPIVDGLTSTKMIRSHEKDTPSHKLSARASLNHRVPIIAVSASLIEKERQTYIDAGFDAWILKPISFPRLNELMMGIVDAEVRKVALYTPGEWEKGGWFDMPTSISQAKTAPDQEKTVPSIPSQELKTDAGAEEVVKDSSQGLEAGAVAVNAIGSADDPFVAAKQDIPPKSKSMPLSRRPLTDFEDDDKTPLRSVFPGESVASPGPIE
jgi:CheY-like chemotaxis protein